MIMDTSAAVAAGKEDPGYGLAMVRTNALEKAKGIAAVVHAGTDHR
jgi:hypothetical protein